MLVDAGQADRLTSSTVLALKFKCLSARSITNLKNKLYGIPTQSTYRLKSSDDGCGECAYTCQCTSCCEANPSKHPVKPQAVDRVAKHLGINLEDL